MAQSGDMAASSYIFLRRLIVQELDEIPVPIGELSLKILAMPSDTNRNGDIFGGWVVSQMDLAGSNHAEKIAKGRVATVAIDSMAFMLPVSVGSSLSFYTEILNIGRSSIRMNIEVWACYPAEEEQRKVTEGMFTFVAINPGRHTRQVPK